MRVRDWEDGLEPRALARLGWRVGTEGLQRHGEGPGTKPRGMRALQEVTRGVIGPRCR